MKPTELRISKVAEIFGVTEDCIRNWELRGIISANRTTRGHRRYDPKEVQRLLDKQATEIATGKKTLDQFTKGKKK